MKGIMSIEVQKLLNCILYLHFLYVFLLECDCNPKGSNGIGCTRETGQCDCKQEWEGLRCEIHKGV